jgi:hypothetical protein
MTWTLDQSGTTSALTVGTETQLGSNSTTNATYVLKFNTSNMANGDVLEARIYAQDISSGSVIQFWKGVFANVQTNPGKQSIPIASDISLKCTLKQVAGTGRTYTWEILRI